MKISRRDVLVAITAAVLTLTTVLLVSGQDQVKHLLPSSVFDWQKLEAKPTKTGERRDVFDSATATLDKLECHVTTLKPGEIAHPPHRHPDEELIILKEGTIEVTINEKPQKAGAGSIFFYASNDLHGMRNVGEQPATYFVFRWTSPGKEGPRPK